MKNFFTYHTKMPKGVITPLWVILIFFICFCQNTFPQTFVPSNGRAPIIANVAHISHLHSPIVSSLPGDMAYGVDAASENVFMIPMPAGTPFTTIGTWAYPVFPSCGVRGGDGNYYVIDVGPPSTLWMLNPATGQVTEIGTITGMESGASANGIAYDPLNDTYYLCGGVFLSSNNLYSLNINTLVAQQVLSFPNPTGAMIAIAINGSGVGYGYDLVDDNAYTFDPIAGTSALLGPIGFDANYGQDMDIDQATGTIYLAAFNNSTFTAQLRIMDPQTGSTTLSVDWGSSYQISVFAIDNVYAPPVGPGYATNPNPPNGATGVNVSTTLTWSNPSGAISDAVWFGTDPNNLTLVQSGGLDSSYVPGMLNYYQAYYWRIDETDGTDTTTGIIWNFTTKAEFWTTQMSGTTENLASVSFTDSSNGTAIGNSGTILRTTDAGSTWVSQTSGTINDLRGVYFTDPNNGTTVGGYGTIIRTTNGGQTWITQSSGTSNSLYGISFVSTDTGTVTGVSGTILRTTDGGNTWITQSSGTTSHLVAAFFVDANTGWAGGQYGTILKTTNGGTVWTNQTSSTTNYIFGISFTDANTGTAVGQNGTIIRTTNGGSTWTSQTSGTTANLHDVSFTDANNGTIVGDNGLVLRTTDGGNTWVAQASGTTSELDGVWFTDSFNGTAVGHNGTIIRTTGGSGITPVELVSFKASVNGGNVILNWATATETNNKGFEIERKSASEEYREVAFINGHGTSTQQNQYSYTDKNVTGGKYTYRLKQIDFDGAFKYSNEIAVDINLPSRFSLSQNYPNPFNPTTTIDYSIPKDGNVTLGVYNILGQQVFSLVNINKKAGEYHVTFDASNLASGIYYYRLRSGNNVLVKKMILLK